MKFQLKRFLVSRFLAALGDQFMLFAVPLVILKSTGSVAYSGLAFAIEWLPRLLFFPISGSIADRVNVRKLYQWADGLRFVTVIMATAIVTWHPVTSFVVLSLMMASLAILNSLAFVGMEASFPRQVAAAELPRVQSLLQGMDQTSQILGPTLAAFASSLVPLHFLLLIGASSFGLSCLNALGLPNVNPSESNKKLDRSMIREAYSESWRVLRRFPILFQLSILTWVVNLMYGTLLVIAPAVTVQTFLQPERYYGILQTSAAILGISAFFSVPRMCRLIGLPGIGILAFAGMSAGAVIASTAPSFAIFALGAAILLSCDGLFNVYIRSLRAQIIPKADLGKTIGLIILINNCSLPLSGSIVSALSSILKPQQIYLIVSIVAIFLGILSIGLGRRIFRYSTLMPSLVPREESLQVAPSKPAA